jgi:hypothetical protein
MKIRRFEQVTPVTLYDNNDFKGESRNVGEGEYDCDRMHNVNRKDGVKFGDRT